ncbi:hypothetical protein GCM10010339_43280 [Streptomyces alanosinicus]|uniref:Uncharacterized protein n=1 Tax=Streptomyces alanosinicus TaxID=68171 RepID=A0A918YK91_9ACTN|nr:hypothetical protein GCM10010339_43280 [Streptomyces alanosinicus]
MPVQLLLDHFLQGEQQTRVGPCGRAAEVRGGDRHENSRETPNNGETSGTVRRAVPETYEIVGYEAVGYEAVG